MSTIAAVYFAVCGIVVATAAVVGLFLIGAWAFGLALDRINRRLP